jgi:hypothetical protein
MEGGYEGPTKAGLALDLLQNVTDKTIFKGNPDNNPLKMIKELPIPGLRSGGEGEGGGDGGGGIGGLLSGIAGGGGGGGAGGLLGGLGGLAKGLTGGGTNPLINLKF